MKDGMEYAEMLGMEVSSCDVYVKPKKTRKKKELKDDVIKKVNEPEVANAEFGEFGTDIPVRSNGEKKKKFRFDVVYAEGVAVFLLAVTILLTNIFWENSGMNRLFKSAFGDGQTVQTDTRTNVNFNAQSPSGEMEVTLDKGVMVFSGKGSLYPVCDGKVASVVEEDGKYTITLKHSDVFKTVISGVDFVYADQGDEVFKYVPVCYVNGGDAKVSMYNKDVLVTNYAVEGGSIVWES
ncbi:MAG: hypothetical protein PUH93_02900 [Clostridia bacterium]|nr:hypothetical protein [Clostridia bacterium]